MTASENGVASNVPVVADERQAKIMPDLVKFRLPQRYAFCDRFLGSLIVQVDQPESIIDAALENYNENGVVGIKVRANNEEYLVIDRKTTAILPSKVLLCRRGTLEQLSGMEFQRSLQWYRPVAADLETEPDGAQRRRAIIASWKGVFRFNEQQGDPDAGGKKGLRPPQLGAIHAALAHWRASDEPATIVMPTGTGKTETMLGLLVEQAMDRVLVVVPTDALRDQTAGKFETLGKLREQEVINETALYPVVGRLKRIPPSVDEARAFLARCNVVVTTMPIMGRCSDEVLGEIAAMCSHLFVDEAHHVAAPTWRRVRQAFANKRVVQFTATPFREDGQLVDGKVIFEFPLRRAQEQKYFAPIVFKPVTEFCRADSDRAIASAAIAQLEADLNAGFDHLVMARASSVVRAAEVVGYYKQMGSVHCPALVHSGLARRERAAAMEAIRSRQTRIVVCVNMLGEGFDLPNLKIAAIHDIHKSLAITLQFVGRFTRAVPGLGDATMIANLGDADVEGALSDLYAENRDWNSVLRRLSAGATAIQKERLEFLDGFANTAPQIALQNVRPKMSAVVYGTRCASWRPDRLAHAIGERDLLGPPAINARERVAIAVRRSSDAVEWGNIKDLRDITHDLVVLYWNQKKRLLFINTSNNARAHRPIAEAVCGSDVAPIRGEQVFRVFGGVARLILTNLGLGHSIGKAVRHTQYMGSDVLEGLASAATRNRHTSNLFARGYEGGDRVTYGCSYRGRVWSHKVAGGVSDWKRWCDTVGSKLLDDSISVDQIVQGALRFATVNSRPPGYPIAVEWPEELFQRSEDTVSFELAGMRVGLLDTSLEIADPSMDGPLCIRIRTPQWQVVYEVVFSEQGTSYRYQGAAGALVHYRKRSVPVGDWFDMEPPVIRFADGGFVISNQYCAGPSGVPPFDHSTIQTIDWQGVNIRRESQTSARLADSIQRRLIETITSSTWLPQYDVVFDDDDTHEIADVIAIKVDEDKLIVHLFHCKFSSEDQPGARVKDLYEVCGQAQRCVAWRGEDPEKLFDHMRRREELRRKRGEPTRFEKGSMQMLQDIRRRARQCAREFRIFVVQPGLSRANVSSEQLELLATTSLYLQETFAIPLTVIASP